MPRLDVARAARELDGLCACRPWRQQFAATLGRPPKGAAWPLYEPFRMVAMRDTQGSLLRDSRGRIRYQTRGISTCGLITAHGIWAKAGLHLPSRWRGCYVPGSAMVRERMYAEAVGAYVTGDAMRWITPGDGDCLILGPEDRAHMATIVASDGAEATILYDTIDGGQVCRVPATVDGQSTGHQGIGLQAIRLRPSRVWLVATDRSPPIIV